MKTQLLVTAAGLGKRLGAGLPKALIAIDDRPLLVHTLQAFHALPLGSPTLVTAPPGWEGEFEEALAPYDCAPDLRMVAGGAERQDSVGKGLEALAPDTQLVVIHDAARPFVSVESVRSSIAAAVEFGAATVALPCQDTVLVSDDDQFLVETPDRTRLWACQTPQIFRVEVIREAYAAARARGFTATDDATLVRANGGRVKLVPGTPGNFKITTKDDVAYAEYLIRSRNAAAAARESD